MDCEGRKYPSSHSEKPRFEEETLWEYPVTQEQPVIRLTRAYTHSLSNLPIFQSLPPIAKRKTRVYHINEETSAALLLKILCLILYRVSTPLGKKFLRIPLLKANPGLIWKILTEKTSTRTSLSLIWLLFLNRVGTNSHSAGSTSPVAHSGCHSDTWATTSLTQECRKVIA